MASRFLTIRQAAREGPLSEYCLRLMLKRGELPGVYSGTRFLVNYAVFLERLEARSGGDFDGA